jgi:hypothetical protein
MRGTLRRSITLLRRTAGALRYASWGPGASALRAAVLARQRAGAQLAARYRERDIQRAQAVERDPALPLREAGERGSDDWLTARDLRKQL